MTYNLWGMHGEWPARRTVLAAELRCLRPDIAVLQETVVRDAYDQVTDLLGEEYYVVHQRGRTGDGTGASIASRWPVTNVRQHFLHVTPRVNTAEPWIGSVALAEVQAPMPYGRILLVHFKPSWQFHLSYERELQAHSAARMVEQAVATDAPNHVILAGDFDAAPDSAMIRFWSGRQSLGELSVAYRDVWEDVHGTEGGHTFVPDNPLRVHGGIRFEIGRRIDYIFVRADQWGPTLAVAECSRILDRAIDGIWASDHFGVTARLEPPT
ncbi:endonuclease/exonuclease/phosphatase family protein [Plantactinospora sp. CA-294935]|uniref:endonuclease/exonuclease/phosphatase family protein n=1 Tax=Plantactinospora sp. CA-294935 TaxID=3240012 RepID=UPI003D8C72B8